jgi:hypothetical protein
MYHSRPQDISFPILKSKQIYYKLIFLGSKVRLVRGADNLTAMYEPIV